MDQQVARVLIYEKESHNETNCDIYLRCTLHRKEIQKTLELEAPTQIHLTDINTSNISKFPKRGGIPWWKRKDGENYQQTPQEEMKISLLAECLEELKIIIGEDVFLHPQTFDIHEQIYKKTKTRKSTYRIAQKNPNTNIQNTQSIEAEAQLEIGGFARLHIGSIDSTWKLHPGLNSNEINHFFKYPSDKKALQRLLTQQELLIDTLQNLAPSQ